MISMSGLYVFVLGMVFGGVVGTMIMRYVYCSFYNLDNIIARADSIVRRR